MKILVVTSVFPNSKQPTLGVFVKERMFKVARYNQLKVIAPAPWFPLVTYIKKDYRPQIPYIEIQEGIEVYHPRFFNIPKFFKFLDGLFFFFSSVITVWKVRKDFDFDIIDAHFVYPDGFGAVLLGKLFKRPVTITVRGTIKKLLRSLLARFQIKYALRRAIRVFTVCHDLKKVLSDIGISEKKVVVIPNGVDIEKFKREDKLKMCEELGVPSDRNIIISVGGLVERKGFHRIISVLPEIKRSIPDVMYVIVGGASIEGNYEPVLRRMVKELDLEKDVLFAGAQSHAHLYRWLSASDIFCLATSNEGWANVFLEAMACGLPVVTTRVGGNEEVVLSEDYGLLFNLGDEKGMVDAIVKALTKKWDREKIIDYARANRWDERIRQLSGEFEEVMNLHNSCISDRAVIQ